MRHMFKDPRNLLHIFDPEAYLCYQSDAVSKVKRMEDGSGSVQLIYRARLR